MLIYVEYLIAFIALMLSYVFIGKLAYQSGKWDEYIRLIVTYDIEKYIPPPF